MIRGSLRGPKRTISNSVQGIINEMTGPVAEAEGTFRKTAEYMSKDGNHVWRAGKNQTAGTWDHRHYSKNGNGWKHHKDHGYDGHESAEDAAAAAKGDRDSHDSGKKIGESYRSFGDDEHAQSKDAATPTDFGGSNDPHAQAKAMSTRYGKRIEWDGSQFVSVEPFKGNPGSEFPFPVHGKADGADRKLRGLNSEPTSDELGAAGGATDPAMGGEPGAMGGDAGMEKPRPKIVLKGKGGSQLPMSSPKPAMKPAKPSNGAWNQEVADRQAHDERNGRGNF